MSIRVEAESDPRCRFAVEVVSRLKAEGFQALWAGGCVRDLLLGLEPDDYDVATDARPEQVMQLFRRTVPVGVSFGVVRVIGPRGAGEVEVATFRSDGAYVDGRRPSAVTFSTAESDASRRDFTINGMFLDPTIGQIVDYVGGRLDLERGLLRAIGDPAARFAEDKLRLLRAVRFSARFGLVIDPETRMALAAMAGQIRVVAAERIAQELRKMLVHRSRAAGMALAMDLGLVEAILPEVAAMKGLPQSKAVLPGGDLWDHTLLSLEKLGDAPSFPLAFATLLHDVGKPTARGLKDGRVTFHGHELIGRRIAEELCRDLRISNVERERVCWLVESHQALGEAKSLREARLKRILAMPGIHELLELHRADALASTGDTTQIDYCRWYLENQPQGPIDPPPLLTGHDLQKRLGLDPGPHFKDLLETVREAQLNRQIGSKAEAIELVRRRLGIKPPASSK